MVPIKHLGRNPLALDHPKPMVALEQKSCQLCAIERLIIGQNITGSIYRHEKILNLKTEMWGACTMQDKVPTVHQIRVGRGALMRVRKSPKKSLWGVGYGGLYLYIFSSDVRAI
jgi:hypothetical protein